MRFASFIARRYLQRGRKYSFISVISVVSILGIAIGVAALVIALSLINGFQRDIRDRILSSSAHLMITPRLDEGIADYARLAKKIESSTPEVKKVAAVVYQTVLIRGTARSVSGCILRGMDLERPDRENWLQKLEVGRMPREDNDLLIGWDLALKLGLGTGDSCLVIVPQVVASPTGVIPRFKRFRVSGIFRSGLYEFDSGTVICRLGSAQSLFHLEGRIHYLQIHIRNIFAADSLAASLKKWLPIHLSVITWKELNESLYSALRLEKTVLFFTLTLIIVVASLNIVAGLFLLVVQKIRDIGILLSYGATPAVIRNIFFIQGWFIGIVGTFSGLGIGLLFCYLANRLRLIRVPYEIYQISHIRFQTTWLDLLVIAGVALLISATATRIPSRRAARISVVDAVKYE